MKRLKIQILAPIGNCNKKICSKYTYIQLQYKLNIQDNHIVEQYNQSKDEKANK